MPAPRLLVIEGNTADGRALLTAAGGGRRARAMPNCCASCCRRPMSISAIRPMRARTCRTSAGCEGYDGVVITGSALHVYDRGPHIDPQIELAKRGARGVDAAVRKLLGPAGHHRRGRRQRAEKSERPRDRLRPPHPADRGRARASDVRRQGRGVRRRHRASRRGRDARARHACAGRERLLGSAGGGDHASTARRLGRAISSGIFARPTSRRPCAATASGWSRTASSRTRTKCSPMPTRARRDQCRSHDKSLAWRLGLDQTVLDKSIRVKEIRNWITHQVLPTREQARTGVSLKFPRPPCRGHRRHRRARQRGRRRAARCRRASVMFLTSMSAKPSGFRTSA